MTRITNQNYPNGLNPLGYMGTNATTPAQQFVQLNRAPTPTDSQNFTMGTNWQVNNGGTKQIWQLVDLTGGVAEWVQIYPAGGGGGGASAFPTDSGTANEVGGVLNILGGLNINTTGVGDTVTVNLDTTISVDGIQDTSMGFGAVLSDGSGNLTSLNGAAGQVLTSNGVGMAPTWQNEAAGGAVTALRADNSVNVTPSVGVINVSGGNAITTSGASHTLTLNLTAPVSIANGGTNATAMANTDGAVYFDGTRLVTTTAGTAGQVLTSNGAGMAPTFQGGVVGITTLTANSGSATGSSVKIQGNAPITSTAFGSTVQLGITNGTNGQLLIAGGSTPIWNNLTSTGATISITYPSNNNINLEATGSSPGSSVTFFYYQATVATNVTGGALITPYALGNNVAMTMLYDNTGGAVTPGTGTGTPMRFTAPATGVYSFQFNVLVTCSGTPTTFPGQYITVTGTSAGTYYSQQGSIGGAVVPQTTSRSYSTLVPMTAADVATFSVAEFSNAMNVSVVGNTGWMTLPSGFNTWVSCTRVV